MKITNNKKNKYMSELILVKEIEFELLNKSKKIIELEEMIKGKNNLLKKRDNIVLLKSKIINNNNNTEEYNKNSENEINKLNIVINKLKNKIKNFTD